MASVQASIAFDRPVRSVQQKPYSRPLAFREQSMRRELENRNPFGSPNPSTTSSNETDSGSVSGLDNLHLEGYGNKINISNHTRGFSRSSNGDERHRPDLNIITTFASPNMPMKSEAVKVNEVQAKQVASDRKLKAMSVVSHKAIQSTATPVDREPSPQFPPIKFNKNQTSTNSPKRTKPLQRLQNAILQRQRSPLTQHIPIGITIPKTHAAMVDQMADSALPMATPITPAIVVTPAGAQVPWVLQRRGTGEKDSASSTYSAITFGRLKHNRDMPPTPTTADLDNVYMSEKMAPYQPRGSQESTRRILSDGSEPLRPESQGWWNLMLSPLLRAGSVASRKPRQPSDTPPVPPLPFAKEKLDSPVLSALSARSDPSFLVSPHETEPSPDTPRRQGLASVRGSTWSRWTEWETEREMGTEPEPEPEHTIGQQTPKIEAGDQGWWATSKGPGLAAEYYHACAVEQLTGEPYFDCINHSCAQKLPKLQSIHDLDKTKIKSLGSPFDENKGLNLPADIKSPNGSDAARSPTGMSDTLSPNELSPNVREASMVPIVKARSLDSSSDKALVTKDRVVDEPVSQDRAASPVFPPAYTKSRNNDDDLPNIAVVTRSEPPPPQVIEIKVSHQTPQAPASSPTPAEKALPSDVEVSDAKSPVAEPVSEKHVTVNPPPVSPGPMSPEGQKSLTPPDAVQLSKLDRKVAATTPVVFNNYAYRSQLPDRPAFISSETEYPALPDRAPTAPVTAQDLETSRRLSVEEHRRRLEKEDAAFKKVGGLWRGRGCFPKNGCFGRDGREGRTKRRWTIGICLILLIIIVVSIVLAVTLTRRGNGTPIDSQWLNLTGFPPMPTGILTIAAPNLVAQQSGCVNPNTMWSCAVPKDDQNQIGTNEPTQPNFRFEITFKNGTVPSNLTIPIGKLEERAADPFTDNLFVPNPSPPNEADQIFLGKTTDNITEPFNGETTPFFITFMPTFPVLPAGYNDSSKEQLVRRQSNSSLLNDIPAPELAADGSAAPDSLLPTTPFPISQPVRLYNRGLVDEHYGFYMYYSKSIFLSGYQLDSTGITAGSNNPVDADQNGGSTKSQAASRCTFAQTRYLIKMFTDPEFNGHLLSPSPNANTTESAKEGKQQRTNSATDFTQPGSFPYPATITLDRHGGDIDTKAVFCYGMNNGQIVKDLKTLVAEERSFGGFIINPAPSIIGDSNKGEFNQTAGGIDGGTGGCECTWQNWQ